MPEAWAGILCGCMGVAFTIGGILGHWWGAQYGRMQEKLERFTRMNDPFSGRANKLLEELGKQEE